MSDTDDLDLSDGDRIVGRVRVYRILTEDGGMRDDVLTDDGEGDQLDMPTAVGILAVAQHSLLCECDTTE